MREMRQLPGLLKQEREGLATLLNILFSSLLIEQRQQPSSPSSLVATAPLNRRRFLMSLCRYVIDSTHASGSDFVLPCVSQYMRSSHAHRNYLGVFSCFRIVKWLISISSDRCRSNSQNRQQSKLPITIGPKPWPNWLLWVNSTTVRRAPWSTTTHFCRLKSNARHPEWLPFYRASLSRDFSNYQMKCEWNFSVLWM